MLLTLEVVWSGVAGGVGVAAAALAIRAAVTRGRLARLPDADPEQRPTSADRWRWHLGNVASLVLGVAGALLMYAVPPASADGTLVHIAAYEMGGRFIGAFFFGLATTLFLTLWFADRLVRPGPLLHILRTSQGAFGDADLRRPARWFAGLMALAAVALHFALWLEHTSFTTTGVRWRDWPWQAEQERSWDQVREVLRVGSWIVPNGSRKLQAHVGLHFRDGVSLHIGRREQLTVNELQRVLAVASERSGLPVREVEADD